MRQLILNSFLITFFFSSQFSFQMKAQSYPLWTQTINSLPDSAYVFPVRTLVDHSGNPIVLSTYSKPIGAVTENKIILNKYTSNGQHLWQRTFDNSGSGSPRGFDMALDDQDNIYVAGGLMSLPGYQPIIVKFSSAGNFLTQWGVTTSFSVGNYFQLIFQNNQLYSACGNGVATFSLSGIEKWSNTILPERIQIDNSGEMIVSSNSSAASLIRFDTLGNINLADTTIIANKIATDDMKNIYLLKQYNYSLVKLDSIGSVQWTYNNFPPPPPFGDIAFDVLVDWNQDVIVTGIMDTIYKFNSAGQLLWKKSMDGLDLYLNVAKIGYNNLLVIAGIQNGIAGYDIQVKSFNLNGIVNWTGVYSSNFVQEFSVDMVLDPDGVFVLEDSISNSNLIKFERPISFLNFSFSDLCVDSIWYDSSNPNLINISVFNGGIGQLNYPSIQLISPSGDTVSNIYNSVNFFAHINNTHLVYTDTIITVGVTDFSGYHFAMYESFADTSGEIYYCSPVKIEEEFLSPLVLFPNPAFNKITLKNLSLQEKYVVEMLDLQGRVVDSKKISDVTAIDFNLSNQSAGFYFLKVTSKNALRTFKFIKE